MPFLNAAVLFPSAGWNIKSCFAFDSLFNLIQNRGSYFSQFLCFHRTQTRPICPMSHSLAVQKGESFHFLKVLPNSSSSEAEYSLTIVIFCTGSFIIKAPSACPIMDPRTPAPATSKDQTWGCLCHFYLILFFPSPYSSSHGFQDSGSHQGPLKHIQLVPSSFASQL